MKTMSLLAEIGSQRTGEKSRTQVASVQCFRRPNRMTQNDMLDSTWWNKATSFGVYSLRKSLVKTKNSRRGKTRVEDSPEIELPPSPLPLGPIVVNRAHRRYLPLSCHRR
ncbi:uncharacterized protein LOC129306283 [Prosopis cineraria]|uniref:uncharacterized protein LOC129306283 n=1 Tax=Prosopis cineraria TaxID=364024 RepID=UPI00240F0D29|nr:uncharacterized protein LOC129306283 [Prosopis cineraria]